MFPLAWESRFVRADWEGVAVRSEPLIKAIEQYGAEHNQPPPTLESLVPKYLAAVPSPQAPTKQPYNYYQHHPHADDYGNSYTLRITAGGFMQFDDFLYHPSGAYPSDQGGNWYERMGKWSYYHE